MPRRRNFLVWAGFAIVLLAFLSYIPLFVPFPVTRDVPWVNFLLFFAGGCLLTLGLKRAFGESSRYRGKISGSILGALSLLMVGVFCYGTFYAAKQIPSLAGALRAGQLAPAFTLADAEGKQIVLADLLKNHLAVLLIFYRGYW